MKNILIIGYGSIGKKHYKILTERKDVNVFLLTSKKLSTSINHFNSLDLAIKFNPEIVVICSPSSTHLYYVDLFIDKKIFVEKPFTDKLDNTEIEKYKKYKNIYIAYNLRFNKSLQYLRGIVSSSLEKITRIEINCQTYLPNWRVGHNYEKSASAKSNLGGGVLNELSHEINYVIWLFKHINILFSKTSKISDLKVDVEDYAELLFESGDILGYMHLNFCSFPENRTLKIYYNNYSILWNVNTGEVTKYDSLGKKLLFVNNNDMVESYYNQWEYFFNSSDFNYELNDAIKTQKIINQIKSNE